METNRERIEKSEKYLKIISEEYQKLLDKYSERLVKLTGPYSKYCSNKDSYRAPKITDSGIRFYPDYSFYVSSRYDDTVLLEWKHINMTDEEFEQELKRVEEEKKQKEIADLEDKIAKLKQ